MMQLLRSEVAGQLGNEPQLIYICLAWKQRLSCCHLNQKATCKDTGQSQWVAAGGFFW